MLDRLDNIVVEDIKYVLCFHGNVLFILSHVDLVVLDAYCRFVDGMDKIYDKHM